MKRALLGAAVAVLCLVAACDEPLPAPPPSKSVEATPEPCRPGERGCHYDDGELK